MDSMEKYDMLLEHLRKYDKLCVAYSGGADSTLLLKAALEAIPGNVVAVIADTDFFSQREFDDAKRTAEELGANYNVTNIDVLYAPQIAFNESNRCYHCKKMIFTDIAKVAYIHGIKTVADGQIAEESSVYRPGRAAAVELGIVSPLAECGINKSDVREISKQLGLPTWNKPTNSCLTTRFPYGTEITTEKLQNVEKIEDYINSFGVGVLRFRVHGDLARIEVSSKDFSVITEHAAEIVEFAKQFGIKLVTLDLEGFKKGSMDDYE